MSIGYHCENQVENQLMIQEPPNIGMNMISISKSFFKFLDSNLGFTPRESKGIFVSSNTLLIGDCCSDKGVDKK
jgi:hypothetical protein